MSTLRDVFREPIGILTEIDEHRRFWATAAVDATYRFDNNRRISVVGSLLKELGSARRARRDWEAHISTTRIGAIDEALSLHDELILKAATESPVWSPDLTMPVAVPRLEDFGWDSSEKTVLIEHIDGHGTALSFDPGTGGKWGNVLVNGHYTFQVQAEGLADEIAWRLRSEPESLGNWTLLSTGDLSIGSRFGRAVQDLPRRIAFTEDPEMIYADLTFDRLAVGVALRGRLHWRTIPSMGLMRWLSSCFQDALDGELMDIAANALKNDGTEKHIRGDRVLMLSSQTMKLPEYVEVVRERFGLRKDRVRFSGWFGSRMMTRILADVGLAKPFDSNNGFLSTWRRLLTEDPPI
jgi:hypothetical protein